MNQEDYFVPSHLDDQAKFFLWDMEEFMAMIIPIFFGMMLKVPLIGVALAFGSLHVMQKLKAGSAKGFMKHVMYWYLPDEFTKMKSTPPSHIREFIG
jgi:conjugal transfer pilus assembly protein TraL